MTSRTEKKWQIVTELYKQARINFKRRKTIVRGLWDLCQADLIDMQPYAKENNGFKYILIVINCFSKYVWTEPLKDKSGKNVSTAMETILLKMLKSKKNNSLKNLQTDKGTEFYNVTFKKLMEKYSINHYSTYSDKKAAIVERVIRTIKGKMYPQFSFQNTHKWIGGILAEVVKNYNNSVHRTIGMKPIDVKETNEDSLRGIYSNPKSPIRKCKFIKGDHVRISTARGVFDKKYNMNWSPEIFIIKKKVLSTPTTYILKDINDKEIKGGFYEEQMQKVKYPDIYLVEKVLKRKGGKSLVKWVGFDDTHNQWISNDNVS